MPFRPIVEVGSGDRGDAEGAGEAEGCLRGGEASSSEASSPANASSSASRSSAIVNVLTTDSPAEISGPSEMRRFLGRSALGS